VRHPAAEEAMLYLRLLAVVAFIGAVPIANAQETKPATPAGPSAISVTAGKSKILTATDTFRFLVTLDRAPQDYEKGYLVVRFQKENYTLADDSRADEPYTLFAGAPVHDGQRSYYLSVQVRKDSDLGKWRLQSATLQRSATYNLKIPEDISFEVVSVPTMKLHIDAPTGVEAAHTLKFAIKLEPYSKDLLRNCGMQLGIAVNPPIRNFPATDYVNLGADQLTYEVSLPIDSEAQPGLWKASVTISAEFCRNPQLMGDKEFMFNVEKDSHLVIPMSATVTINPQQSDLLRAQAGDLRAQVQRLQSRSERDRDIVSLQKTLTDALKNVDTTEAAFKKYGSLPAPKAVDELFDDVKLNYGSAIKIVYQPSARPHVLNVSFSYGVTSSDASNALIKAMAYNAAAYERVASTQDLVFYLDVTSDPQDATISYWRIGGDVIWQDKKTNSRIDNITIGTITIRLQKDGFDDYCFPFDGVSDARTSVGQKLHRKQGQAKRCSPDSEGAK
jgi:hypothetical protein